MAGTNGCKGSPTQPNRLQIVHGLLGPPIMSMVNAKECGKICIVVRYKKNKKHSSGVQKSAFQLHVLTDGHSF